MVYCIDTSALLEGWVRHYPPDIFPALWENLRSMIDSSELISPEEVLVELSKKDDLVYQWAKENQAMFVPLDDETQEVTSDILTAFPRLVGQLKDRNSADPFVIAVAMIQDAVVVTSERPSGSHNRPKIPDVCEHYGIRCINLLDLIREQGWQFR